MFVKPGTGPSPDDPAKKIALKVRDPITKRLLPDDGADVPDTSVWRRMIRDKDVILVPTVDPEPPKNAAAETAPETAPATKLVEG